MEAVMSVTQCVALCVFFVCASATLIAYIRRDS